jgi:nickel/cobalt transporter (NicO) family protein
MNSDYINEILYTEQISPLAFVLVLVVSFVLGAIHALGPGHGKSLMAAYLVGARGRLKDVFVLAASFTFSHVFSVFIIGIIALLLTDFFWSETLNKWISLFSGLMIVAIALWLFFSRIRTLRRSSESELGHSHQHHHLHARAETPEGLDLQKSIALGISGGIVPCPKALVILFLAISLHRVALGLLIIIVFSLGLAALLATIGIVMVKASHLLHNRFFDQRIQYIPLAGSVIILALGILMTITAWQNL